MGSMVTGRVSTFISSDGNCTQVWHMRFGHIEEKSLQAPTKKEIIGRCIYLQHGIGWMRRSEHEDEGEIRHHHSPLEMSS